MPWHNLHKVHAGLRDAWRHGGNSVKENFHGIDDGDAMVHEVEGLETCNTYNMLELTRMLFQSGQHGQ